ncbi:MAG: homoserine kinase [Chloroflexota bacterium]
MTVPATSANLGSGFDCLALALDIPLEVRAKPAPKFKITLQGEGAAELPTDEGNLVVRAYRQALERLQAGWVPLDLRVKNHIPLKRGLGSSAAATVAGVGLAYAVAGRPFQALELLRLAAEIEGHPDNAAAAVLGGIVLAFEADSCPQAVGLRVPRNLGVVLFVPDREVPTEAARRLLPEAVPLADAVFNLSRSALWVVAILGNRLELLRAATEDRLHQPARRSLIPELEPLTRAALEAGALGACLSGAGPSVIAFVDIRTDVPDRVAQAWAEAAGRLKFPGRVLRPAIRRQGITLYYVSDGRGR